VAAPETPRPFSQSFSVLWSGRIAQELLNTPREETPIQAIGKLPLVVNLHWVPRWLDLPSFLTSLPPALPVTWTLHGLEPITGGCHYPGECDGFTKECGNCPQQKKPGPADATNKFFRLKERLYQRANLHFVGNSEWTTAQARRSGLAKFARSIRTIHYGLDVEQFKPVAKAVARTALGLADGKFVVRPRFQTIAGHLYKLVSRRPARLAFRDVDLIHHIFEASPLNGFAAAAAARHWGIPFVVSPTCHPHHVGDSPLDLRLYRQANRLLVYTKYERHYLKGKLIDCAIDVVGIGIEDRSDGNAKRFRTRFGVAGPLILYIGRKDRQKGYLLLLDAFKVIRRQRPDVSLVCMGPAESTAKQQQIEGLIDLDFTSEELKHDALAACTCVCIPSEGESFGLVYMEAGRYGKPAVGRKVAVLEELLRDGVAAVLVGIPDESRNRAVLSPEALAAALLKVLSDPKECERIGENCRAVSEQFLWPRVVKRFEASYYQAVEKFKNQPTGKHSEKV
jgi:glycosyltransferase involved in cell wall biosynthesis